MKIRVACIGLAMCVAVSGYDALAQTPVGTKSETSAAPQTPTMPYSIRAVAAPSAWHSDLVRVPFQIKNVGNKPLLFVPPLDGSFARRSPRVTVELTNAEGKSVEPRDADWCGVTNPLCEEDFITLQPGETRDLNVGFLAPSVPGEYSLRVVYDTTERDPKFWLGSMSEDEATKKSAFFAARIARVLPVRVVSDAVAFSVRGATAHDLEMLFLRQTANGSPTREEAEQLRRDGENGLWKLEDKREFAGHFSAVLRLAPYYKWSSSKVSYAAGRYLFASDPWWRRMGASPYPLMNSYVVVPQSQAAQLLQDIPVTNAENILRELHLAEKVPPKR